MKQFFFKKERGKFDDVCVNNFESLDKMDNFLGKGSLPSLTSSEAETVSKLISPGETEKTIKELLQKKSSGPNGFTGEVKQTFKNQIVMLHKLKRIKTF